MPRRQLRRAYQATLDLGILVIRMQAKLDMAARLESDGLIKRPLPGQPLESAGNGEALDAVLATLQGNIISNPRPFSSQIRSYPNGGNSGHSLDNSSPNASPSTSCPCFVSNQYSPAIPKYLRYCSSSHHISETRSLGSNSSTDIALTNQLLLIVTWGGDAGTTVGDSVIGATFDGVALRGSVE